MIIIFAGPLKFRFFTRYQVLFDRTLLYPSILSFHRFDADYGTPINPSIPSFHRYDADQWYPTQSKASMFFTGVMLITGTQLISSVPSFRKYDANQWNTT